MALVCNQIKNIKGFKVLSKNINMSVWLFLCLVFSLAIHAMSVDISIDKLIKKLFSESLFSIVDINDDKLIKSSRRINLMSII